MSPYYNTFAFFLKDRTIKPDRLAFLFASFGRIRLLRCRTGLCGGFVPSNIKTMQRMVFMFDGTAAERVLPRPSNPIALDGASGSNAVPQPLPFMAFAAIVRPPVDAVAGLWGVRLARGSPPYREAPRGGLLPLGAWCQTPFCGSSPAGKPCGAGCYHPARGARPRFTGSPVCHAQSHKSSANCKKTPFFRHVFPFDRLIPLMRQPAQAGQMPNLPLRLNPWGRPHR
jgi:hypothetical protein